MQTLTKSKLMSARQCLKRLHLEIHRPELARMSASSQSAVETGNRVGDIARQIYGTDQAVLIPYGNGLDHALQRTGRLVEAGPKFPIFEATFQHSGVLVRVDVLMPDRDGWRIVEVKASTALKAEHAFDCAVQCWVFQRAGHRLNGVSLAHVDKTFVYRGDGDYRGLLLETDMAEEVRRLLPTVPDWIRDAHGAAGQALPDVPVGSHCRHPWECPFIAHCWPSETAYPVLGLGGNLAQLAQFVRQGFQDLRDVPASYLSERQRRIQRITLAGRPELLAEAARCVRDLAYPRYYLDFETIAPAVPVWAGTRPYEVLPFQWSCHIEIAPGQVEHAEFLELSGKPPMRSLAESLVRVLGKEGPILAYTDYEKRVIVGLIARFPDLQAALAPMVARLVDLAPIARRSYYHPAMHGSWSLKALLPTIAEPFRHQELDVIREGVEASAAYLEAIHPATLAERRAELRRQLLRYCRKDTQGMLELAHLLAGPADANAA